MPTGVPVWVPIAIRGCNTLDNMSTLFMLGLTTVSHLCVDLTRSDNSTMETVTTLDIGSTVAPTAERLSVMWMIVVVQYLLSIGHGLHLELVWLIQVLGRALFVRHFVRQFIGHNGEHLLVCLLYGIVVP